MKELLKNTMINTVDHIYTNKFDIIKKSDAFLETLQPSKTKLGKTKNSDRAISSNEITAVIETSQTTKGQYYNRTLHR